MARAATKAIGNPYYEARIRASEWNEKLSSRAGAAEMLNVSEDVVKDAELGLYKNMPVDVTVLMADAYNEPSLLNYHCKNECPIGRYMPISDSVMPFERVTLKLIKRLNVDQLASVKDRLIEIAEDGEITEDETEDMAGIIDYLNGLAKTISELKIVGERIITRRKLE